jgi:sodium-dependent phosphate cotransporter
MEKREIVKRAILLVIILYVFLLSIKLMGISFKLFGRDIAEQLLSFTTNPFIGLFIGILATSVVQSSSVTTSILVGLTASGALSIGNAIPIIMGANIGTSVTNTIVSLGHITNRKEFRKAFEVATVHDFFNFIVVLIMFPLEIYFGFLERSAQFLTQFFLGSSMNIQFTTPLNYVIKPVAHWIQELLSNNSAGILVLSFAMLFLSLRFFVKIIKPLAESEFKHLLHRHVFKTPLRSFALGLILTAVVQSSSVSTSLMVPLAGVGIMTPEKIFPYILGANIGTTITAMLASLVTGSPAAISVALAHLIFNGLGSAVVYPIRMIPVALSRSLAHLSFRSRMYPLAYIASMFYVLPIAVIFFFH